METCGKKPQIEHWHELTINEKIALKDHVPEHIASIVKGYSLKEQETLYQTIYAGEIQQYIRDQLPWIHDVRYYLGQKLDREPTPAEEADELLKTGTPLEFRLCWLATHPSKIKIRKEHSAKTSDLIIQFLKDVRQARIMQRQAS